VPDLLAPPLQRLGDHAFAPRVRAVGVCLRPGRPHRRPGLEYCASHQHRAPDCLEHRYYDPTTGQFLSVDPLVTQTGQPYQYAADDPVNGSDPSGLNPWDIVNPWSPNNPLRENAQNGGLPSQLIQTFDPAYLAISGYTNEWQATENGCGLGTELGYGAQGVLGVAGSLAIAGGVAGALEAGGYFTGNEFEIGDNFRISPFGNGNAEDPAAQLPHYHWRQPDEFGNSPPGQDIGQHRPWQGGFFPW